MSIFGKMNWGGTAGRDDPVAAAVGGDIFGPFEVDRWCVIRKWRDPISTANAAASAVVEFLGGFGEEVGVGEAIQSCHGQRLGCTFDHGVDAGGVSAKSVHGPGGVGCAFGGGESGTADVETHSRGVPAVLGVVV